LRAPGTLPIPRELQIRFWVEIAKGPLPIGGCWFHSPGGTPLFDLSKLPSWRYLSSAEREEVAILNAAGQRRS
jgi:hypothetical protein